MRHQHRPRSVVRYATIALSVLLLISVLLSAVGCQGRTDDLPNVTDGNAVVEWNGTEYVLKKKLETFLVLGLDKSRDDMVADSYNNDRQADFLMLFVFDNEAQKYSTVHINRDTMAKMYVLGVAGQRVGTVTKQIALAHTYGNGREVSCRNTSDAVSELLLGMKINHYLSITRDAVPIYNDLLGGVSVEVLDDFSGVSGAESLVKGETVTLMGDTVLTYVSARQGMADPTNAARMVRQQQYLRALQKKTEERINADPQFVADAAVKLSGHIVSDRSVNQLQELARKTAAYEFVEINNIEGELRRGETFVEFYPNEASIKELVMNLFYEPKK